MILTSYKDSFLDLLGKLDDKYVTLPLEEDEAKRNEQETSSFEEGDSVSEKVIKA